MNTILGNDFHYNLSIIKPYFLNLMELPIHDYHSIIFTKYTKNNFDWAKYSCVVTDKH